MDYRDFTLPVPGLDVRRPWNLGRVIYVDAYATHVSDTNEGNDPNHPLKTMAAAMLKATANQNDYIIVLDAWSEDTEPIVVNKARTHLIGVNTGPIPQFVVATPSSDTAEFQIPTAGQQCEIAGFNIGGGASRGGIQTNTSPYALWIHHNVFGHEYPGSATPKYGIESNHAPTGMVHSCIEDNIFWGTDGAASFGKIDTNGMLMYGCKALVLRRNKFMGIPGINGQITDAVKCIIEDNKFALDGNTTGRALTLIGCAGCWIDGNSANFGKTAMADVPWADDNSDNHWGSNYNGDGIAYPA